ncbi:MAG TPA: sigma-70 family RNA polymerase sigma factor [Gaiellaceae bacterium]|nr:sigma-70 family RNA polymerase sigma factor [Gaiellaceae bacterium]
MSIPGEAEYAAGDWAAGRRIGALFDDHAAMVLAVCRMHLRDPHDAEDAAQQTFLSAYRSLLGGARPQNAAAWLATIARNECRTRISRRLSGPVSVPLGEAGDEEAADVYAHAARRLEVDALRRALGDLPERQREAVVLRDFHGLSYDEVAAVMSVSAPAVESLLSRGRRALAERVAPLRAVPAIAVPGSLRDELARLIPGFADSDTAAAAGVGAAGVLAKLATASLAGKAVITAAVATLALGGANVASDPRREVERAARQEGSRAGFVAEQQEDATAASRVEALQARPWALVEVRSPGSVATEARRSSHGTDGSRSRDESGDCSGSEGPGARSGSEGSGRDTKDDLEPDESGPGAEASEPERELSKSDSATSEAESETSEPEGSEPDSQDREAESEERAAESEERAAESEGREAESEPDHSGSDESEDDRS